MGFAVNILTVNSFDFDNMRRGVAFIWSGGNPWAENTRLLHYYNPPFAGVFLWPMLFTSSREWLIVGSALLFAFAFYHRAWIALAWFGTNTVLWIIASGGIDMLVIGLGVCLLTLATEWKSAPQPLALALRVLAYGVLMIKPQGGMFIVGLYILYNRDWQGLLWSCGIYGLLFGHLIPDWIRVLLTDPPLAQTVATHTLWAKYGSIVAGGIALAVVLARRWSYWALGGALAGILSPYGMPGLPIFLILTSVRTWRAIPIVLIWSGLLALLTWVAPPAQVDFYEFLSPFMAIYHLSMLGLALVLSVTTDTQSPSDTIDVRNILFEFYTRVTRQWKRLKA